MIIVFPEPRNLAQIANSTKEESFCFLQLQTNHYPAMTDMCLWQRREQLSLTDNLHFGNWQRCPFHIITPPTPSHNILSLNSTTIFAQHWRVLSRKYILIARCYFCLILIFEFFRLQRQTHRFTSSNGLQNWVNCPFKKIQPLFLQRSPHKDPIPGSNYFTLQTKGPDLSATSLYISFFFFFVALSKGS